ncbi:hypothetical protein LguiA_001572 [Lonicera macranthoides]
MKTTTTKKSHTLPSSPTHSSSSSDFEFTVSLSPLKSSSASSAADDLFYKGQLLPLHLSPRLSMVRTLLLSSSSTSSSSTTTTTTSSRPSSSSSTDCDSSRPSSATPDDLTAPLRPPQSIHSTLNHKKSKYFSLSRFSSVFKQKTRVTESDPVSVSAPASGSSVKRISTTAKDVICKYLKKVKPLYEKLSQKQQQQQQQKMEASTALTTETGDGKKETVTGGISYSFSGNLRYPMRRRSCVSSCPSSMRSSPSHSGILSRNGGVHAPVRCGDVMATSSSSSMEELQSAIQGAIAHCKNSMSKSSGSEI